MTNKKVDWLAAAGALLREVELYVLVIYLEACVPFANLPANEKQARVAEETSQALPTNGQWDREDGIYTR